MTRLYLQPTTEPANNCRQAAARDRDLEIPYVPIIVILVMLVLAFGFNAAHGHRLDLQARGMAEQYDREHQKYKHWTDVIGELRKTGAGRLSALNAGNATGARAVWLESVKDRHTNVVIEGMAVSPSAVADMISKLRSTGDFSHIEIDESYQDSSKNKAQAFKFRLTCEVDANKS
jgi:hypothetical protein